MGANESTPHDEFIDPTPSAHVHSHHLQNNGAKSSLFASTAPSSFVHYDQPVTARVIRSTATAVGVLSQPNQQHTPQLFTPAIPRPTAATSRPLTLSNIQQPHAAHVVSSTVKAKEKAPVRRKSRSPPSSQKASSSPKQKQKPTRQKRAGAGVQAGLKISTPPPPAATTTPPPTVTPVTNPVSPASSHTSATSVPSSTTIPSTTTVSTDPSLPASAATLAYFDSLLKEATSMSATHQHNVEMIAKQLRGLQDARMMQEEEVEGQHQEEGKIKHLSTTRTESSSSSSSESTPFPPSSSSPSSSSILLATSLEENALDQLIVVQPPISKKQRVDEFEYVSGGIGDTSTMVDTATMIHDSLFQTHHQLQQQQPLFHSPNLFGDTPSTPAALIDFSGEEFQKMRDDCGGEGGEEGGSDARLFNPDETNQQDVDMTTEKWNDPNVFLSSTTPSTITTSTPPPCPHHSPNHLFSHNHLLSHPNNNNNTDQRRVPCACEAIILASAQASQPSRTCTTIRGLTASKSSISQACYEIYRETELLRHIEHNYSTGRFTADAVRYQLTMIHHILEPQDEVKLMQEFEEKMNLGEELTTEDSCCWKPNTAPTTEPLQPPEQTFQEILEDMTKRGFPALRDNLSPLEAVEDDEDGVPRLRANIIFGNHSKPEQQKRKRKKNKREEKEGQDDEKSDDSDSSSTTMTTSSTTTTPLTPLPSIYRLLISNRAYERFSGYTQREMISMSTLSAWGVVMLSLRSDHLRAFQSISAKWRIQNIREAHLYQVRITRDGKEVYCLCHIRIRKIQGVLHEVTHSFMQLPKPEEGGEEGGMKMPPFVEGVDLDEDTLLYGYKPTAAASTSPAPRLVGIELNPGPSTIESDDVNMIDPSS